MAHRVVHDNVYSMVDLRTSRAKREADAQGAVDLRELLSAQSEIAQAGLDLKRLVDAITRKSQALTGSTGAVVEMLEGDELVYWSASGSARDHVGLRIPAIGSLSGLCIARSTLLTCRDSDTDPRVDRNACRQLGLRSAMVTPLQCEGALVGVLKVVSDRTDAYTRRHEDLLQTLAAFIGSMLHSALEHARVSAIVEQSASAETGAAVDRDAERARLQALIESGRIRPVFQPIVELANGRIVGHEALSRFDSADPQPVHAWFQIANRLDMCLELESACMSAIVEESRRCMALPGYISLNVSPKTLMEYDFAQLPARGDRGGWVLEITEHSVVTDYPVLARRVQELQAQGFRIAIDDAGAGYASLRHVLRLAPDIVKLDVSLTRDIDTMLRHQQLASAIMSFSRETGMALIAEGVETPGERDTLVRLGVPYAQGYLFGRPAPAQPAS